MSKTQVEAFRRMEALSRKSKAPSVFDRVEGLAGDGKAGRKGQTTKRGRRVRFSSVFDRVERLADDGQLGGGETTSSYSTTYSSSFSFPSSSFASTKVKDKRDGYRGKKERAAGGKKASRGRASNNGRKIDKGTIRKGREKSGSMRGGRKGRGRARETVTRGGRGRRGKGRITANGKGSTVKARRSATRKGAADDNGKPSGYTMLGMTLDQMASHI